MSRGGAPRVGVRAGPLHGPGGCRARRCPDAGSDARGARVSIWLMDRGRRHRAGPPLRGLDEDTRISTQIPVSAGSVPSTPSTPARSLTHWAVATGGAGPATPSRAARALLPPARCTAGRTGAVLVEAHDEWQTTNRRYLAEATTALLVTPPPQEGVATPELMTA